MAGHPQRPVAQGSEGAGATITDILDEMLAEMASPDCVPGPFIQFTLGGEDDHQALAKAGTHRNGNC